MIDLGRYDRFSYDTETTGLQYPTSKVFGFSIATPDGKSEYHDIRLDPGIVLKFNRQMRKFKGDIICHNASFDYRMSHATGIYLPIDRLDDTVIRSTQVNEHEFLYTLDWLAKVHLGESKVSTIYEELAAIFGGPATRDAQILNLQHAPVELVRPYAIKDAILALKLWEWQRLEIDLQGIHAICDFERDKLPTFIRAEMRGIRVDLDYAEQAAKKLTPLIDKAQWELNKIADRDLNVNSPKQIRELFVPHETSGGWVASDGTPLSTTDGGNPSMGADALRAMKHPAAPLILSVRSLIKTRDTFLIKHVVERTLDGRVYPTINQTRGEDGGTKTGRLSYAGPAMQQIPSRNKEVACIVKPCFLPDLGMVWVNTDMASFEVRIFAHLIDNMAIIQAYIDDPGLDLHQYVADLSGLPRNASYSGEPNAKQMNLSLMFNSGNGAIAQSMGLPWHWETFTTRQGEEVTYRKAGIEAESIIAQYHHHIPGVKKLAEKCKSLAENRGFLFTYSGRRLRFPNAFRAYKASATLIQSTAACANKENWKMVEEELGDEGHLILNTHDSYAMSLPENWRPLANKVKKRIETPGRFRVPLILDIEGAGKNWWDAIENKDAA